MGQVPNAQADLRRVGKDGSAEARFVSLDRAALACLTLGKESEAKKLAEESLQLRAEFPEHWNAGNSTHNANAVLGLVALQQRDLAEAERRLLAAGRTEGSPQLASFGPNMRLAKRLLELGRVESVKEYLLACREFWADGSEWLDAWCSKIDSGEVPHFPMHLYK